MTDNVTTVDRIAMVLGGGLILLGTAVLGTLEAVIGSPASVPNPEEGVTTTFPPELRAYLVAAGLVVLGLYAGYRLFASIRGDKRPAATVEESPAR